MPSTQDVEQRRLLFKRLLAEHGGKIYAFAYRLTGNDADAADLTSEAFMKAFRSFDRYDEFRTFHSWLFKIVQNIHLDAIRREDRRATVPLDALGAGGPETAFEQLADGQPSLDTGLLQAERGVLVQRALDRLPGEFRVPLALCDVMEMDYAAIAGQLGIPVGTVRSRIFRGRRLLREMLTPYVRDGGGL